MYSYGGKLDRKKFGRVARELPTTLPYNQRSIIFHGLT